MNRNTHPLDLEDGSITYALNAVRGPNDKNFLKNEKGTTLCTDNIPLFVIGSKYISGGRTIVFSTDEENSEIGLLQGCTYTPLFSDPCLNFNRQYPIDCEYRVTQGCFDTIYFVDGINPPRFYKIGGEQATCRDLELFPSYSIPCLETNVLNFGGSFPVGSAEVFFRYVDANGNATNWVAWSKPLSLISDSLVSDYVNIDGAFSLAVDPIDGEASSQKSIEVVLTNLDLTFTHYQLGVINYSNGNGVAAPIKITDKIPISATSFILNGSNFVSEQATTSVEVDRFNFTAAHIQTVENRLVLLNTREYTSEDCLLQEATNNITLKWITKTVDKYTVESGNPKHPNYGEDMGYMRDEVYAISIHYVFDNGRVSRGFHVPGRAGLLTDAATININTALLAEDAAHLGLVLGDSVPRYLLYNTAAADGTLGYYQADVNYPNDPLWGSLAGTPIRHHRMPDASVAPIQDRDNIFVLGLEASNIVYPSSNIVGHFFSRSIRGSGDKTVREKAAVTFLTEAIDVFNPLNPVDVYRTNPFTDQGVPAISRSVEGFTALTLDYLFNNSVPSCDFMTFEMKFNRTQGYSDENITVEEDDNIAFDSGDNLELSFYHHRFDNSVSTSMTVTPGNTPLAFKHRQVEDIVGINPQQQAQTGNIPIVNPSRTLQTLAVTTNNTINLFGNGFGFEYIYYVSLKNNLKPYGNLETIQFTRCHPCVKTPDGDNAFFGGDVVICPLSFQSVTFVNTNTNILGNLTSTQVVGGLSSQIYFETDSVNTALRISGKTNDKFFFSPPYEYLKPIPFTYTIEAGSRFLRAIHTKFRDETGLNDIGPFVFPDNSTLVYTGTVQNYFRHNPDFILSTGIRRELSFPYSTASCDDCDVTFKNRMHWSEPALQEELVDNFRVFLPNNYRDLDGTRGPITDAAKIGDQLVIFTTEGAWLLPSSYQERTNDAGIVSFVGTGEFLSLPPKMLIDGDVIAGGCVDKWATINIPQGLFWVDSIDGAVYINNQSINGDMDTWFIQNMKNYIRKAVEDAGGTFPTSPYLATAISAYDRDLGRVILTYKDYEPLLPVTVSNGEINSPEYNGKIVWSGSSFYTVRPGYGIIPTALNNPTYFCNKSWTLSYDIENNEWLSFHSYNPNWYIQAIDVKYYDGRVWTLGSGPHSNYGEEQFKFTVETKKSTEDTLESVQWYSEAFKKNVEQKWVTFEELLAYNSNQATGILPLTPRNTLEGTDYLYNRINTPDLERFHRIWRYNRLRDRLKNNRELFISQCTNYFESDVSITDEFEVSNWWDDMLLTGPYVLLRLSFSKPDVELKFRTLEAESSKGYEAQ